MPTSSTPGDSTGVAKLDANPAGSKNSASYVQSSLPAKLKEGNEGRPSKSDQGRTITQASGKEGTASANKSSTPVLSGLHETEITNKARKGSRDSAKTSSKTPGTKTDASAGMRSPVRAVSSHSDAEENSKEHCLMTYTALPSTPEKKVGRICRSIVKEGKAMVAFPSPSKPHSLPPNLVLPQCSLFKDQTDMAEPPQSFSSTSCSLQGKSSGGEASQGSRGMFDDYSQLNFSNKIVLNDAAESLNQGVKGRAEHNPMGSVKESISVSSVGGNRQGLQSEEESQNSDILQGIENERMLTDLREFSNVRQEDHVGHGSQSYSHFRGDDNEEKGEEEEDSDVLRIEEHSENEYEDVEVISKIELEFSDMIDIFSSNLDHESEMKSKQHTPSPPATKQKRKEKNSVSPRRKTPTQCTQKAPTKCHLSSVTPKRPLARKGRGSGATSRCRGLTEKDRTEVGRTSISTSSQSLTSHKFQRSVEEEPGCYAGRSRPVERKNESCTPIEKRRRITPIRIGDVEPRGKLGIPKEPHWGHNRGSAGVHWET